DEEENDDGDDDYDEDDDDDDNDDDDEEPLLRFRRMPLGQANSPTQALLTTDMASALLATDRFLVLGTHFGHVHILDPDGGGIAVRTFTTKQASHASASVTCISVDSSGDYVASSGDDGRVIIRSMYSDTDVQSFDFGRPVKAVALDPMYAHSGDKRRRFVSGGTAGMLVMTERKWLVGGMHSYALSSGRGSVLSIVWRGDYIAWCDDEGVSVINLALKKKSTGGTTDGTVIGSVRRPQSVEYPELHRCRLRWASDSTLLVGWGDTVRILSISSQSHNTAEQPNSLEQQLDIGGVQILRTITLEDAVICGVALFGSSIMALTYAIGADDGDGDAVDSNEAAESSETATDTVNKRKPAHLPELRIIGPDNTELARDALAVRGFEVYQPTDYHLECSSSTQLQALAHPDATYYILSPRDAVLANRRTVADSIAWLAERSRYGEMLELIDTTRASGRAEEMLSDPRVAEAGMSYVERLMDESEFATAATVCSKVFTTDERDVPRWESVVYAFAQCGQLKLLAPALPTDSHPPLPSAVYEMVLADLLDSNDLAEFKEMVFRWPARLYSAASVIMAAEDKRSSVVKQLSALQSTDIDQKTSLETDLRLLMEALARICDENNLPDQALSYHLQLFTPGIIDRIRKEAMFAALSDKVLLLMQYDVRASGLQIPGPSSALMRLLVEHTDAIPARRAVHQLLRHPYLLHVYLHALSQRDINLGSEFHDLQIELYAEYNPEHLTRFLRTSVSYSLEKALVVCEQRGASLIRETIYILGRMGDVHGALNLIIHQLADVEMAIEFAKEQNDDDLWNDLINYSKDKPVFIRALLEMVNGGDHVDASRLIKAIEPGLEIPGLRQALIKVLKDQHVQVELRKGCDRILQNDTIVMASKLHSQQRTALSFNNKNDICSECAQSQSQQSKTSAVIAFFCNHAVHARCI
ncbi:hypothetical protein GQ42DRAFT_116058, partial [Ramicandelaber brevisporus]